MLAEEQAMGAYYFQQGEYSSQTLEIPIYYYWSQGITLVAFLIEK